MDEVGILLGCNPPFNVSETLGSGRLANWWNIQSIVWALYTGELAAAGVDMIGASQFVGWPVGPPGTPVAIPFGNPKTGAPYQPQIDGGGNCPEMSMVSWVDGTLNARSWTMKMIIDGLGHGDKAVFETNVTVPPMPPRQQCKQLTRIVNRDMAGGDICEFSMTENPSNSACAAACCDDPRCDHFVSLDGAPDFSGGGTCTGRQKCNKADFCCYLKTAASRSYAAPYKNGTCIAGTTTAAAVPGQQLYARAFAPAVGDGGGSITNKSWPGPGPRAILMANLDSRNAQSVSFEGLKGAKLWSVVPTESGAWAVPYATTTSSADTLTMAPLSVTLAFF